MCLTLSSKGYLFMLIICLFILPNYSFAETKTKTKEKEIKEEKKNPWGNNASKFWDYNPNPIMYFQNTLKTDGQIKFKPYDSLATHIQQYDPMYNLNVQTQNLGSIGRASNSMIYNTEHSVGFNYGRQAFDGYMYYGDSVRFYNNRKYFTSISYVMGGAKENNLHLLHSQNLHKGLYLTLDYRLFSRTGKYIREKVDDHNLSLTMRYFTRSNVYGVYGGWVRNRIANEENGGIKQDEMFQENLEPVRSSMLVNLPGANSKVKNDEIFFTQYVSLSKRGSKNVDGMRSDSSKVVTGLEMLDNKVVPLSDSLRFIKDSVSLFVTDFSLFELSRNDSINPKERRRLRDSLMKIERKRFEKINLGRFVHSFSFKTNRFITTEAPAPNIPYDQISSQKYYYRDSVNYYTLDNQLAYTNAHFMSGPKEQPLIFLAGANFQYIGINRYIYNPVSYFQIIPKAMLETNFLGFKIKVNGEYAFGGYNNHDFMLTGLIRKSFKYGKNKNIAYVELNGGYSQQMPDYFMQVHDGRVSLTQFSEADDRYVPDFSVIDNFWHNDFNKLQRTTVGIKYKMKDFEIGSNLYSVTNYVYFDQEHLPKQFSGSINGFNVYSKFKVRFWKFSWDNNLVFQMNNNDEYLKLPHFLTSSSLYCTFPMFRKALIVQVGIDAFYNTQYYADNYLASLNAYYLQNDDFMVGNYPYFDAFVNLTIKRATLFLKYSHLNKGMMGYNYYYTPHYPYNDGSFHLGITWRFYD